MRFTWIYILFCAVVVTNCGPTSERPPAEEKSEVAEENVEEEEHQETLEDLVDLGDEKTDLPILPPIILIDFTNGTNLTSEEKSKRTINGNLGYGFQSNQLFTGKYNYYFPAGKTGTTVSIEESISPFLPTTIIEKVNFVPQKLYSNPSGGNSYTTFVQSNLYGSNLNGHAQSQIGGNGQSLAFGQRTKLQKSTVDNFQSFSRPAPTQKPNYISYTTPKPSFRPSQLYSSGSSLGSYSNPSSNYESFSTARPSYSSPLQGRYNSFSASNFKTYDTPLQSYGGVSTTRSPPTYKPLSSGLSLGSFGQQGAGLQSYSTPKPQTYNSPQSQTTILSPLGNAPKYSYMDGIKYEHKIVWKYPNGMVSEIGPNSYDTTYSEYSSPTKVSLTSNYQNPGLGNNFPQPVSSGYSVDAGAIYSQKPATFPDNGSPSNDDSKSNQFVSSASISTGGEYFSGAGSGASQPTPPSQKYSFQDPYSSSGNGQSSKTRSSTSSASTTYNTNFGKSNPDDSKVVSSYPVNSPEAEYPSLGSYSSFAGQVGAQESPYGFSQGSQISDAYGQHSSSSSDSTSGKIEPAVLSKYTPQVQQYLKKALGLGESGQSQKYETSSTPESYSNIQYSNLLNYNPSISQYVSDPSSILNAQPTFVQAGNSLIPVIILRVDGAAPVQPKATPNINLKALLQKYLTQYAQTVTDLSQGKSFDRGYESSTGQSSSSSKLFDLGQLTQSLGQLDPGSDFKQNFAQSFAQSIAHDYQPEKYGSSSSRESPRKPKVKSVEIIDDPRFTSFKLKN